MSSYDAEAEPGRCIATQSCMSEKSVDFRNSLLIVVVAFTLHSDTEKWPFFGHGLLCWITVSYRDIHSI
jgi:hypothetical protein